MSADMSKINKKTNVSIRERCEKYVRYYCSCPSPASCDCLIVAAENLETLLREIRNETLEEAAQKCDAAQSWADELGSGMPCVNLGTICAVDIRQLVDALANKAKEE